MPLLPLLVLGGCASQEWRLRLDNAALPDADCGGEEWDSDEDGPDVYVEVVANWNGETWTSNEIEDETAPSWGEAVWGGEVVEREDLQDFGIQVTVGDADLVEDDVAGTASVRFKDADFETGSRSVDVDCAEVQFSVLPG